MWAIETRDGRLLGDLALRPNPLGRWADLGIFIGEKGLWDQGYGADAVRTALRYAFSGMRLNRVSLTTDEANARAIRCYERCGFVREGLLRQQRLVDGQFRNAVLMGLLREEFPEQRSPERAMELTPRIHSLLLERLPPAAPNVYLAADGGRGAPIDAGDEGSLEPGLPARHRRARRWSTSS